MHSGFVGLRSVCPMNIEAHLPDIGALALRDKPAVRADLNRICSLWSGLLQEHDGPMLFGHFTVADAYFAPVVMRLKTYALPVPADVAAYMARACALPGVKAWIDEALAEQDFIDSRASAKTVGGAVTLPAVAAHTPECPNCVPPLATTPQRHTTSPRFFHLFTISTIAYKL